MFLFIKLFNRQWGVSIALLKTSGMVDRTLPVKFNSCKSPLYFLGLMYFFLHEESRSLSAPGSSSGALMAASARQVRFTMASEAVGK